MEYDNYRHDSKATLKVYGNSVDIKEEFFPLSRLQRTKLLFELVRRGSLKFEVEVKNFEELFEEHVLKYGHEFEKYNMPPSFFYRKEHKPKSPPQRQRGDITGFSQKSRYRLLKKLNQLNPDNKDQFFHVTLTYPKRYPMDGETHKADLDAFIKRIKRRFGEAIAYLWKLEFQKRGAPHYHMIIHLPKFYKITFLRKWFSYNWFEVAQRFWEEKIENHRQAGVGVDNIASLRKAGAYLSKYISKEEENTQENQGRYWGCSRNWGEVVLNCVNLTGNQLIHFRRLVKRFLKGQYRMQKLITQPLNLTVFGHWSFFTHAIDWVKQTY